MCGQVCFDDEVGRWVARKAIAAAGAGPILVHCPVTERRRTTYHTGT